jgi:CIC family chloride channel protein
MMLSTKAAHVVSRLTPGTRMVLRTCAYGVAGALVAVTFHVCIQVLYLNGIVRLSRASEMTFVIGSFLLIASTSALSGWLLSSFCPAAAGSGIPRLKSAFWRDFGYMPASMLWVKFVGGVLSVGGGASLGREGPSVQLGGGVASSVVGALVAQGLLGEEPAFSMASIGSPESWGYLATPLVAAIAALVGGLFQKMALSVRHWNSGIQAIVPWVRTMIGGIAVWVIGCVVFHCTRNTGVFGLGYEDLSTALRGELPAANAAVLLGAKLLATAACYGLGGCGGIFAPTLFFGAMTGVSVAALLGTFLPLDVSTHILLAVVGMSSCLTAVVRAPVTGILIVFEMTHDFAVVPPLMIAALVSRAIATRLSKHSLYDALLEQDGIGIDQVVPPRDLRAWQDSPVSRIANFRPALSREQTSEGLRALLGSSEYERFPAVDNAGRLLGILTRAEAQAASSEDRLPRLVPAPTCRREDSVRDAQVKLIESRTGMIVLVAGVDERVIGILTLHDLLRAEFALSGSG